MSSGVQSTSCGCLVATIAERADSTSHSARGRAHRRGCRPSSAVFHDTSVGTPGAEPHHPRERVEARVCLDAPDAQAPTGGVLQQAATWWGVGLDHPTTCQPGWVRPTGRRSSPGRLAQRGAARRVPPSARGWPRVHGATKALAHDAARAGESAHEASVGHGWPLHSARGAGKPQWTWEGDVHHLRRRPSLSRARCQS